MELKRMCVVFFLALTICNIFATSESVSGLGHLGFEQDPELEICKHQCRVQVALDRKQRQACVEKCEAYHRAKEAGRGGERQRPAGGNNPYVFRPKHFQTAHRSDQGRLSVIPRFTERSNLFERIERFRFGVLEVESKTFVAPTHHDADLICFVANGKGILNMIRNNKRERINIKPGNVFVVPAGSQTYLTNTDNDNKLVVVQLIRTISTPGRFQFFFSTGSLSFLNAFSSEINEAAFGVSSQKISRILGKQSDGPFIELSDEQLKSIRQEGKDDDNDNGDGKSKSSKRSVNIFKHKSESNKFGQLFEVDNDDLDELRDINVAFANITQRGMLGPLFNTRGTKLAFVLDGNGWMEMASPEDTSSPSSGSHSDDTSSSSRSHSEEQEGPIKYERIRARLTRGTMAVIPAGHPYVDVASKDDNLQLICFHVDAENNRRIPLAGKNNPISLLDDTAKEIAFGVDSLKEVDEVFEENDDEELFSEGPEWDSKEEDEDDVDGRRADH